MQYSSNPVLKALVAWEILGPITNHIEETYFRVSSTTCNSQWTYSIILSISRIIDDFAWKIYYMVKFKPNGSW